MKITLILFALISILQAEESERTWVDSQGRKIVGTLVSKTDKVATINLSSTGKDAILKLESLAEESRAYIVAAKINRVPRFTAVTSAVQSNAAGTQKDARSVQVALEEVGTRACTVYIVWLGEGRNGDGLGIWKTGKGKGADGKSIFSTIYDGSSSDFGRNYKGWVAGLKDDESGKWLKKIATMKAYEHFLDEAKYK